jgi:hypothetical protein
MSAVLSLREFNVRRLHYYYLITFVIPTFLMILQIALKCFISVFSEPFDPADSGKYIIIRTWS